VGKEIGSVTDQVAGDQIARLCRMTTVSIGGGFVAALSSKKKSSLNHRPHFQTKTRLILLQISKIVVADCGRKSPTQKWHSPWIRMMQELFLRLVQSAA
jgi:hypothetical protein